MSNLGKYQELIEEAYKAGGVDELINNIEVRGAKKAAAILTASIGLTYGGYKIFEPKIKKGSKLVKDYSKKKIQEILNK
ncbi:hypothetical protein [Carnobacterium maltaromaticum]|uniref:hypothetical protein n=1 Tax=Carnobacterium maltaromaticum TaxID=2751 RepID=UPI00054FBA45|nr:hypothetical protein [Carnobacterium maltaromaticum]KRN70236.1 hypothetical protein IV70_GL000022 [Carnobacterium maltaromaticum DSM 20342]